MYHHGSRLDLYVYGGDEYTGRHAFLSPTGTAAGYGSPLVSYASCTNEVALNDAAATIETFTRARWLLVSPLSWRVRPDRIRKPGHVRASQSMERFKYNARGQQYRGLLHGPLLFALAALPDRSILAELIAIQP